MSELIYLDVKTDRRNQFIDITSEILKVISDSGIDDGMVELFVPHTTAAITINENADPSVKSDILSYLEKLIPHNGQFSHAEGNSDAHIKSSIVGTRLSIFVSGGEPVLGTWQGIYFCEFDGPRNRKLIVKIKSD
ncbi:MAG: YjbQ family protein [Candidatus Zixiibacteriota bacterium]|nr:MAG: YjbQ family protein [candidate division Zixibacteria bacterium]